MNVLLLVQLWFHVLFGSFSWVSFVKYKKWTLKVGVTVCLVSEPPEIVR